MMIRRIFRPTILVPVLFFFLGSIATAQSTTFDKQQFNTTKDSLKEVLKNKPSDTKARFTLGKMYYSSAVSSGKEQYMRKAEEHFRKILSQNKTHALTMAYLGSLITLKGKYARKRWDKMDLVKEGCALMDKAVDLQPQNIKVRMIRAFNNVELPGFFNRLMYAIADLEFLRQDRVLKHLNENLKAEVWFTSGIAFEKSSKPDRAKEMYQHTLSLDIFPQNAYRIKAKNRLAKLNKN
ncbi:tetratricopeptide repeat protein [Fodinibius halophilus]|uniref:Tetratricopeptide repeat protein n=1 Tax=Fodinibius halophilus TaxID=1736908 RepID=A0A6M1SSS5_9BACT|nr:hypothetical protein [Fodinibius halophilus]NGP86988.1 hypothetical protein [Fodinibius halophilus]